MSRWAEPPEAYSTSFVSQSVSQSVCHYASVGGATRHTVTLLSVCLLYYFSDVRAVKLVIQVELDNISLLNMRNCIRSFILELWRDLLTSMAVVGDLDFSEDKTTHSWLPSSL